MITSLANDAIRLASGAIRKPVGTSVAEYNSISCGIVIFAIVAAGAIPTLSFTGARKALRRMVDGA
jgi:hypothetical protein